MHYIKVLFESDWGNAELAKPAEERHPLLNLYQAVCAVQQESEPDALGVRMSPVTGAVSLYLGLAYDLYCVEHNANTQPVWDRLMHRLRTREDFEQASYEALAGGAFARAGFALDYEDDTDSTRKHVEFVATHPTTGRRFAVECKRRRNPAGGGKLRVISHLNKAIKQNETKLPLITFIEIDQAVQYAHGNGFPPCLREAVERLEDWANDPRSEELPAAYILLTNQPQRYFPDAYPGSVGYLHGFKIPELRFRETGPLEDLVDARDMHPEVHDLLRSLQEHSHFPTSFDGLDRHTDRGLKTPLDFYDFMHGTYKDTPREQLLQFMQEWPDLEGLQTLSQPELAKRYAIRWALNMLNEVRSHQRGDQCAPES